MRSASGLMQLSSGFKGEPVGGLLGVVVDEDEGTVPPVVGLVAVF